MYENIFTALMFLLGVGLGISMGIALFMDRLRKGKPYSNKKGTFYYVPKGSQPEGSNPKETQLD